MIDKEMMFFTLLPIEEESFMKLMSALISLAVCLTLVVSPAVAQYRVTNLVSDQAGLARYADPNLLDAWGMAELPGGGFIVADALSGFVTFYSRSGTTLRSPVTV